MDEWQTGRWMNGVSVSFLSIGEEGQVLRSDYGGQSPRNSPFIPMSQPIESSHLHPGSLAGALLGPHKLLHYGGDHTFPGPCYMPRFGSALQRC